MRRKYKLTKESITCDGHTLHRIRALKSFASLNRGDLGGWIESEDNLSQEGNCWVYENGKIFCGAKVKHNAIVTGNATVTMHSEICHNASISGYAEVNSSLIRNNAFISDHAIIRNSSIIYGYAMCRGNSVIDKNSVINGDVIIEDNALVESTRIDGVAKIRQSGVIKNRQDYLVIGPLGSRADYTTFYRSSTGIMVSCGCFNDNLDEFYKQVLQRHHINDKFKKQYLKIIEYVKKNFK